MHTLIQIYSNYACVLRRTGHLDRAVEWYRLSLSLNPQDPDTHSSLGFTYHLLRRYVLAKDVYVGYMCTWCMTYYATDTYEACLHTADLF